MPRIFFEILVLFRGPKEYSKAFVFDVWSDTFSKFYETFKFEKPAIDCPPANG
jgi:hypothetical protein